MLFDARQYLSLLSGSMGTASACGGSPDTGGCGRPPRGPRLAYGAGVRWEALFEDLEAQLEHEERAALAAEVAERTRAEQGRWTLGDRLRAGVGSDLTVVLGDGTTVRGRCAGAAAQWLVLRGEAGQALLPVEAVVLVRGLSRVVAPPPGVVERRLGLRHALRGLARERAGVRVRTRAGTVDGTLDRVGEDHVDVAEHPGGEARRAGAVRGVASVPLAALLAVHSR